MPSHLQRTALFAFGFVAAPLLAQTAASESPTGAFGDSKLLLTGGVSSIDGVAGGGLTPWATVGSYATDGEVGATAFLSRARTQDYGLAWAWRSGCTTGSNGRWRARSSTPVPRCPARPCGWTSSASSYASPGDAVLDPGLWLPQIAVGVEAKHVDPGAAVGAVLDSVEAKRSDVDFYISATKLVLAQGVLLNGTLRATRANQNGLLASARPAGSGYRFKPELSAAWLLRKDLAIGAEVRCKPDSLAFSGAAFREQAWKDLFVAWAPSKHVSLTAAYVELGNVVGHPHQGGTYLGVQLGY